MPKKDFPTSVYSEDYSWNKCVFQEQFACHDLDNTLLSRAGNTLDGASILSFNGTSTLFLNSSGSRNLARRLLVRGVIFKKAFFGFSQAPKADGEY